MTLNEIFQTLKSLSKADLNSVKEYLESLELNFNGFEDFLLTKKSEKSIPITFILDRVKLKVKQFLLCVLLL